MITLESKGYSLSSIRRRLLEEGISISLQALYDLIKKFREKGTFVNLPRRTRQRKITENMKKLIEEEMNKNDELTARRVRNLLSERWPELQVSLPTVKRVRQKMGWVCTRPHYCQLIRNVRKRFMLHQTLFQVSHRRLFNNWLLVFSCESKPSAI